MCYHNRAHFTKLWLKTGLGWEETAGSIRNDLHTEFFTLKPESVCALGDTQVGEEELFYIVFPARDMLLKGILLTQKWTEAENQSRTTS